MSRFGIYLRYVASGGTAAMTNIVFLFLFTDILHIYYLISTTVSYMISFFISFGLQKFWTFGDADRDKLYGQMAVYFAVALANLLVNDLLMYLFVGAAGINHLIAQILTSGSIAVYSFAIYKIFVFKDNELSVIDE